MLLALPFGPPAPRQLIDLVAEDAALASALVRSVRDGEVDGYNDLGPFRRRSHRGSRAEAQSLQHLGRALEPLGGEWEEVSNQARFLFPTRFSEPLRLVHCRGEMKGDDRFRIGLKGERSQELINENRRQMALFERTSTTPATRLRPIEEPIYNLWIMADASCKGELSIYLAYPTELSREWLNKADLFHMNLVCDSVRLLWSGALIESELPLIERPKAAPIEEPFLLEREDAASS